MSADALEVRNRVAAIADQDSRNNLAVIITSITVLISALSLLCAGVGLYIAIDVRQDIQRQVNVLHQEVDVMGIRAAKTQAWLDAHGIYVEDK